MKDKKKILIVGSLPPPIGGVSVHIKRLVNLLELERENYITSVMSISKFGKKRGRLKSIYLFFALLSAKADVYHLHKPDHLIIVWYTFFILNLIGKKTVLTLHNENLADEIEAEEISFFKKISLRLIFRRFDHIICVNQRTSNALIREGVLENNVSVIPAFIPQDVISPQKLPKDVLNFVDEHSPILTGYSHRIYLYKGHDRYGGDMMLEVINRLKKDFPNIGLVMVMPNIEGEATKKGMVEYKEYIENNKLGENILIYEDIIDLPSLFSISDLHVRPSNTDGDPVAVRESLCLGIPTVASDCTFKPEGTHLHRDRDNADLESQVRSVLGNLDEEKHNLNVLQKNDFGGDVISIYDKLLSL